LLQVESVVHFCNSMQTFLEDTGTEDAVQRSHIHALYKELTKGDLNKVLEGAVGDFGGLVQKQFQQAIGPQLQRGAQVSNPRQKP
jgi:hypothetical protein